MGVPRTGFVWLRVAWRRRDLGSGDEARELERRLRAHLDALGPALRAELLHVLMLPDFERADAIGSYWGNPKTVPSARY
jgi:hypothetical protein